MQPALRHLSAADLVDHLDRLEARNDGDEPDFGAFNGIRRTLSYEAWCSFSDAIGWDAGPLSATGVATFALDESLARRLSQAMLDSPRVRMRRADFARGYISTGADQCAYLNACNQYHALSPLTRALLADFMAGAGPVIEHTIGHPFRIASTRQFQLVPNRPLADRHVDGWPPGIRKIFLLPQGCGQRSGTTWFERRDGVELTLESEAPIWLIFENSVVRHQPIPGTALRPTVELDIVPAQTTGFDVVDGGLGGWYPQFPTERELLDKTRLAFDRYLEAHPDGGPHEDWRKRLRRYWRRLGT